ncbi:MAG: cyclase family protein [Gammaproteobacteria bacterium]|nr:cyclase family protein [Gammaproteobacteria bacterium]
MRNRILVITLLAPLTVAAQSRDAGPWWPSEWGPEDQAGASNRITPEKVLEATSLVKRGKIYELGHVYTNDMPLVGARSYSLRLLPGGDAAGRNGNVGNDEFVAAEIGQVGTQFDGLGHIGAEMKMADGSVQRVFYNGYTAREMNAKDGLRALGVEQLKPILTHGILLDIAGYKGVQRLAPDYEITVADARGALARQGINESAIKPGDAVLFRTGYGPLWYSDTATYNADAPGIGVEVARWLVAKKVTVTGGDTFATEISRNPDPELFGPVHQELMTKNGVFNIENMIFEELVNDGIYEFMFIATPIRYKGATGSPLRPLAIN